MSPSLADKKPLETMRACIMGAGGSGKTHLIGTFAKAGRVAIADTDGDGVDTLLGWRFREKNPWFNPALIEYEKFHEKLDDYGVPAFDPQAVWKLIKWLKAVVESKDIKTIALDSLSSASIIALYAGVRTNHVDGRSKTWATRVALHTLHVTQADFGAEMGIISQILEVMKRASELNKHFIVTAHIRENKTKEGALISREPLVTGDRLRAQFANHFSDVWFLDVVDQGGDKGQARRLITDTTPGLKGIKSRLGIPQMLDPSYEKIVQELQKKYKPQQTNPK